MTLLRATQVLAQAGLDVGDEIIEEPSNEVEEGLVVGTDPSRAVLLLPNSPITIVVSLGPDSVAVPSLIGLTAETAAQRLDELELVLIQPVLECNFPNDTEELAGRIMGQIPPADEEHPPGTEVTACLGQPASEAPSPGGTVEPGSPSGPAGPIEVTTPRQAEARNAALAVNTSSITASNQPGALGSIANWNSLSSRFESECMALVGELFRYSRFRRGMELGASVPNASCRGESRELGQRASMGTRRASTMAAPFLGTRSRSTSSSGLSQEVGQHVMPSRGED